MSPDDSLWHYSDGTSSFGPIDSSTLAQMIETGVVRPEHFLRRESDATWIPASGVTLESAAVTSFTPSPGVPNKTTISSRALILAPPLLFSSIGLFAWQHACALRFPNRQITHRKLSDELPAMLHSLDPTGPFSLGQELFGVALFVVPAVILGWVIGSLSRARHQMRLARRKPPLWWKVARAISGIALMALAFVVVALSRTSQGPALLTSLYFREAAGSGAISTLIVGYTLVVATMIGLILSSWREVKRARRTDGKESPATAACLGTSMVSLTLLVASMALPLLSWMNFSPRSNPDEDRVRNFAGQVEHFYRTHGTKANELILAATKDPEPWVPWEIVSTLPQQTPNGDVIGLAEGQTLKLILDGKTDTDKPTGPTKFIPSSWHDHPLVIAFDTNDDGLIELPNASVSGRAVVWSVGWNAVGEGGRGDDTMTIVPP